MTPREIVEKILLARGVPAEGFEEFLHPSLAGLNLDPNALPGIVPASDIILASLEAGHEIVVFGDYDCDGVCATAILLKTLRALVKNVREYGNANISAFLPDRLKEGYGMTDASVSRFLTEFPRVQLVVTVDNGINSVTHVAQLKAKGIKVVITDHHLPGPELPDADALVNPMVAASPDLANLCGAGVAFHLANRIVSTARDRGLYTGPKQAGPLLVLAGIATITDVMPIVGQNRILVSEAVRCFPTCAPYGLKALYRRAAKTAPDKMTARDFGFLIGPRVNAAGRLKTATVAMELLLCEVPDEAEELARIVDNYNFERKQIEQDMSDRAMAQLVPGAPAQVIDLPEGHPGIAGIVAARILEKLLEDPNSAGPVCVIASGHGSARSPANINVRDAFTYCEELLDRYGGHAAAAGFSVKEGCVDAFRERLCDYCRKIRATAPDRPTQAAALEHIDLWLEPSDLTLELAQELACLEPFGEGNPVPTFGLRGVTFSNVEPLGIDGRHLQVVCSDSTVPRGVWWGHGDLVDELRLSSSDSYDLVFALEMSTYGELHLELRLRGIFKTKNEA